jgi:hypothetical protein
MPKKLQLKDLKVQSFVTNLDEKETNKVRAGDLTTKEFFCTDDACPTDFSYCTCFTECPVNCLPTTRPCII